MLLKEVNNSITITKIDQRLLGLLADVNSPLTVSQFVKGISIMTQAQDDLLREVQETRAVAEATQATANAVAAGMATATAAIQEIKAALDAAIANGGASDAFLADLAAQLDAAQGTIAAANTAVSKAGATLDAAVAAAAPAPAPAP